MIHIIIGTKAQLVKMAPVMVCLAEKNINYNFILTGQHRSTIEEMLEDFGVKKPNVILYKGKDITSVFSMFLWCYRILCVSLVRRKEIFHGDSNGIVLVHGDTFSTLLGALMGRMASLKVGHIESGLRSFNLFHPFPEEITRILTSRLCNILFCPGNWAIKNVSHLMAEKINIHENTLYDSLALRVAPPRNVDLVPDYPFIIVSLHRYENIFNEKRFRTIVNILLKIADHHKILFILHPPTKKQLHRFGLYERFNCKMNISLRPRYNHSDFIALLEKCEFVVTDGGSLQEETYYLGIPCLLLRKATERQEGIGKNVVLSNYDEQLVQDFCQSYRSYKYDPLRLNTKPSEIIVQTLLEYSSR
jgi:UDP-N-acetylglucosamine 2-epimerase (non-hydrolysing)